MSIILTTGTGQTTSATSRTPLIPDTGTFNYRVDEPGESIMENTLAPLTQPNTLRYAYNVVSDVFKNSIATPVAGQRKDGMSMLFQLNEVWKVSSTDDSITPYFLPVQFHSVIKIPRDEMITATLVAAGLDRLYGCLQRDALQTLEQALSPLMRGITRL